VQHSSLVFDYLMVVQAENSDVPNKPVALVNRPNLSHMLPAPT